MKYNLPNEQGEVLPNLLGLTDEKTIALSEFEGFLRADSLLNAKLSSRTRFTNRYIQQIHKLALGHLYAFAGKWRDVNMSKGGFVFPSALYLPQSMEKFEQDILMPLPKRYDSRAVLTEHIAIVHGELLFLHPFRDGNGRVARMLANMMLRQQGYADFKFQYLTTSTDGFDNYVRAVQACANSDYQPMINILQELLPDE
jgi:cell filamentation protein